MSEGDFAEIIKDYLTVPSTRRDGPFVWCLNVRVRPDPEVMSGLVVV